MTNTLVIDTSFGSTVGVVGHEPVVEINSRSHVERLQVDIALAVAGAGMEPHDLDRIIVGVGPGPYTGLRAGIVAAKAIAFASGATLIGQDILTPQAWMAHAIRAESSGASISGGATSSGKAYDGSCPDARAVSALAASDTDGRAVHLTLAVNDARRRQVYFTLIGDIDVKDPDVASVMLPMDIDYPDHLPERIQSVVDALPADIRRHVVIDVIGHGAVAYAKVWERLACLGAVMDESLLDMGTWGLSLFADHAIRAYERRGGDKTDIAVEPLYLRRPDVSIPNPLKHVLNHSAANRVVS